MSNVLTDEEKQAIIDKYHTDKNYDLWDAFDAIERAVLAKAVDNELNGNDECHDYGWMAGWNAGLRKDTSAMEVVKARRLSRSNGIQAPQQVIPEAKNYIGTNTGHGHVWERPDGMKARCGGVGLCKICQADKSMLSASQKV